jgi:Flp pilus assembly CpaE family ATPase
VPGCRPQVVVNNVRKGPINGDAIHEIRHALARHAGIDEVVFVPYDRHSLDKALAGGHTLAEVAPDSPARLALLPLAARYAGVGAAQSGQRGRRRRVHRRLVN